MATNPRKVIIWNQKLGRPECPYLRRWVLDLGFCSIRLHNWFYGDDPRHFHDHPWRFAGIVLKGNYIDITPNGRELMHTGKVFFRPALHKHTVETSGCWTLLITGREFREWGFYTLNKSKRNEIWLKAKRYFIKFGHHPCN